MWADGTLAYYVNITGFSYLRPACGSTSPNPIKDNTAPPAVVQFPVPSPVFPSRADYLYTRDFTQEELQFMAAKSSDCPPAHFTCPGVTWYCLPVYVRCNGVYDCPGHEDEAECDGYTCPGEVSAINICLITLDRFLVLRFPFRHKLHFRKRSAQIACAVTWAVGTIMAAIPLLPEMSYWQFYSQNGICIPLPITRKSFPGQDYSFGVMIVLNFVLFLLIAVGQVFIYWSIRSNSMSMADSTTKTSKDLAIARRLVTIALSDFLCWFPIGCLGLMAAAGQPISGELNVAMAIFVLPFNSALNPFLYTVNVILERRRQEQERRLQKMFLSQQGSTTSSADKAKVTKTEG
nr:hypothetical protein BaRGS_029626 [Batillaria attramentaria]